jgi:hypothetical protein
MAGFGSLPRLRERTRHQLHARPYGLLFPMPTEALLTVSMRRSSLRTTRDAREPNRQLLRNPTDDLRTIFATGLLK